MHIVQPQDHTLYINGKDIPIIIPGDMEMQIRNRTLYFQLRRILFPKELMGVLTNHVWAEGCLDYDKGYAQPIMAGAEPTRYATRFEGHIGINSYEEKWVELDMLVLNHVHFVLHLK